MDYDTINLLSLQPDDIQDLNIVRNNDVIIISVTLTANDYICPACGSLHSQVKDYQLKKINHSIFNMNKTLIHYRCRRLKCVDCGKTFVENNPFTQQKQSFHAIIKREWLNRYKIWDYQQAKRLIFEYIETFYNTIRIHGHCDYLSPDEYEKEYYANQIKQLNLN